MSPVFSGIALTVIAVLLFELIIFIHELGHFISAKKSGVQVNEFALGMGPKIFSFTKGETRYSLRLFPIGGFCSMEAEDEESDNPRAFTNAKIWKRMIIIIAGAVMNIVLGLVLMFVIVVQSPNYASTTISVFEPNAYSANCGLQEGDTLLKINNYDIYNAQDLNFALGTLKCHEYNGDSVNIYKQDCTSALYKLCVDILSIENAEYSDNQITELNKLLIEGSDKINNSTTRQDAYAFLKEYYGDINSAMGIKTFEIPEIEVKESRQRYRTDITVKRNGKIVELKDVDFYTYMSSPKAKTPSLAIDFYLKPIKKDFFTVLQQTGEQTISVVRMVWSSLVGLLSGDFGFNEVSGPVGIASTITTAASMGLETGFLDAVNNIIYIMMIITVNLGIFNMLPFPALDGGRFLFLLIEAIFKKPIPRKVEMVVNAAGLVLLLGFSLIVTFKDVINLF